MEAKSLGWMIHEKACHLLRTLDERIEDQFQWVTEALFEAKKTLADPTIQLIPKTPSEKKKRLRIWRRPGAVSGYRRFSNSRMSNFRGSHFSIKKSSADCSLDFSSTETPICRTDLMKNFSETTPNSLSWLDQRQPNKYVTMTSVAVQTDNIFIVQSIEPVCGGLGSGEPGISKESGCKNAVSCNSTQSVKNVEDTSADLIEFLTKASEKSCDGFCSRIGGGFCVVHFDVDHEIKCLMLDRDKVIKRLASQLVDKILPSSTPDECRQVALLQTKIHTFRHDQNLHSIVLTFKKTFASECCNGGNETVLNGDTSEALQNRGSETALNGDSSEALQQISKTSGQPLNGFQNKADRPNSLAEKQTLKESFAGNNLRSPIKISESPVTEMVDSRISELGVGFPVERPASMCRSSSVCSLSSTGSRSLDSLDVRVSVGTDCERYSTNENRDSIYCAVAYDPNEQKTHSIAPAAMIRSCDVSGIEVITDDPTERRPDVASGVCCNPSSFSLSKICGTEINTDDAFSDGEDAKDAAKKPMKRQSKTPGKLRTVRQRPSYGVGPRTSISGRKSLLKASGGRKSLLRGRLIAAQKKSFNTNQNLAINVTPSKPNTGQYTVNTARNNQYGSGYRIYKSARRRSSALAVRPAPGTSAAPSMRYQAQRTSARKDLLIGDGMDTGKNDGMTAGKGGGPRRSITRVTPVAVSRSRIQKLRKLFSPLSKSKTPTPNVAVPALTPRPAPPTLPTRQSQLQMWRGAELSALVPGSPSAGKTWYKASPFMHCFNSPRRSSIIENPRIKGRLAAGTIASSNKSANKFVKGNQKLAIPSCDAEKSSTPRSGLFKRLQEKMKTPGKDSPLACLATVPQPKVGAPLCHIRETTKGCSATKPPDSDNASAENPPSLKAHSSAASVVVLERIQDCVVSDVGSVPIVETIELVKASQDSEFKILIDVCSLDPSEDDPLIVASNDAVSSYDISDLRPDSDDSDEDVSTPQNKTQVRMVPLWAEGEKLALALMELDFRSLDLEKMFGRVVPPNLNEMFDKKKPRFDKRTSSANWEHPLDLRPFQL